MAPLLNESSLCPSLVTFINADHPESPCASTSSNNRVSDQLSDGSITGQLYLENSASNFDIFLASGIYDLGIKRLKT